MGWVRFGVVFLTVGGLGWIGSDMSKVRYLYTDQTVITNVGVSAFYALIPLNRFIFRHHWYRKCIDTDVLLFRITQRCPWVGLDAHTGHRLVGLVGSSGVNLLGILGMKGRTPKSWREER